MIQKFLLLTGVFAFVSITCFSQKLNVGDQCPDFIFGNVINHSSPTAKLSDFKGKLVLLDFWATHCSNCIMGFPERERLQKKYGDKIQVILINDQQDADKIVPPFWKKSNYTKNLPLPCVIDDKQYMKKYFPWDELGLQVWIDGKGIVRGITSPEYVNEINIEKLLNGEPVNWPVKYLNHEFDFSTPLISVVKKPNSIFYSSVTNYIPNIARKPYTKLSIDSIAKTKRMVCINESRRVCLVNSIFYSGMSNRFPSNRLVFEVEDVKQYEGNFRWEDGLTRDEWRQKNAVCYDSTFPISMSNEEVGKYMLQDFNRYFNINARFEKRMLPCLLLVRTSTNDKKFMQSHKRVPVVHDDDGTKFISKGKDELYESFRDLINNMGRISTNPIIIDETNYKGKLNLLLTQVKADGTVLYDGGKLNEEKNLLEIKRQLKMYDLDLVPAKRMIEVFVVTERK